MVHIPQIATPLAMNRSPRFGQTTEHETSVQATPAQPAKKEPLAWTLEKAWDRAKGKFHTAAGRITYYRDKLFPKYTAKGDLESAILTAKAALDLSSAEDPTLRRHFGTKLVDWLLDQKRLQQGVPLDGSKPQRYQEALKSTTLPLSYMISSLLEGARRLDRHHQDTLVQLSRFNRVQGDVEKALAYANEATDAGDSKSPESAKAWVSLALAHEAKGNIDPAVSFLHHAINIAADTDKTLKLLSYEKAQALQSTYQNQLDPAKLLPLKDPEGAAKLAAESIRQGDQTPDNFNLHDLA